MKLASTWVYSPPRVARKNFLFLCWPPFSRTRQIAGARHKSPEARKAPASCDQTSKEMMYDVLRIPKHCPFYPRFAFSALALTATLSFPTMADDSQRIDQLEQRLDSMQKQMTESSLKRFALTVFSAPAIPAPIMTPATTRQRNNPTLKPSACSACRAPFTEPQHRRGIATGVPW